MEFIKEKKVKSNLYMMCGIPASGKSYYARKMMETQEELVYVSRDEIRFSKIKEGQEYFSKEKEVFSEYVNRIQSALDDGKHVIADATQLNRASRAKLLKALNLENVVVTAIDFFDVPYEVCLERNSKREGRARVPEDSMYSMKRYSSRPKIMEDKIDAVCIMAYKGE